MYTMMKKYNRKRAQMNTHARTHAHTHTYIKSKKEGLTETRTQMNEKQLMPY